jgi:hypothetical protein
VTWRDDPDLVATVEHVERVLRRAAMIGPGEVRSERHDARQLEEIDRDARPVR